MEAEGGGINKFGVSLGIDLPLANLNQGEIAKLEAARDKLRDGFLAKVHEARAEVHEAQRALEAQERLVRLFEDVIKPALDENARADRRGARAGRRERAAVRDGAGQGPEGPARLHRSRISSTGRPSSISNVRSALGSPTWKDERSDVTMRARPHWTLGGAGR